MSVSVTVTPAPVVTATVSQTTISVSLTTTPVTVTVSGGFTTAQGDARYLLESNNLSDLVNASTARTNLGVVAGGAGDIWVEKAGDTMTGPLLLAGTGRVLRSVDFEPDALKKAGVGPDDSTEDGFPIHDYDPATDESVFLHWEIPHNYASAGEIHMHVEFFVDTAPTSAKNVTWGLEYKKLSIGDNFDFSSGTTTIITNVALTTGTPANDKKTTNSGQLLLTTTGLEPMDIFLMRIFRDANASEEDATDDFGSDARVFNYHLMYLSDKLGQAT